MHVYEATPPYQATLVASTSWYQVSRCDGYDDRIRRELA